MRGGRHRTEKNGQTLMSIISPHISLFSFPFFFFSITFCLFLLTYDSELQYAFPGETGIILLCFGLFYLFYFEVRQKGKFFSLGKNESHELLQSLGRVITSSLEPYVLSKQSAILTLAV